MARPASSLNRPNTCTHTHKQRNKIQTHIYTDSFTPAYPLIHLPLHHNLKPSKYHTHTHTHTHEQRNKIHTHIYTNSFTPTYPHIHLPLYHNLKPSKYHTHTHTHTNTCSLSHTHTHTHTHQSSSSTQIKKVCFCLQYAGIPQRATTTMQHCKLNHL